MDSRKRLFLVVVAIAVLFGVIGFVLGGRLESPEDARAEVAAPEASLIAVPIESVALSNDVVVRGDAEYEGAVDLELEATLGDGTSRVVTGRLPEVDTLINEGDVLIEVSGRPVFALGGELPGFREFKPGLEGDDVLQLEEALARLGYLEVTPDGLYGTATEDAVTLLYEAAGYEPRSASDAEDLQIEAAEDQVEARTEALANANDALSDLISPPSQVERITDERSRQALIDGISDARDRLSDAEAARRDLQLPSVAMFNAMDALESAEALGDASAIQSANQNLAQAQQADQDAEENLDDAVEAARDAVQDAIDALADHDELEAAKDADRDLDAAREAVADAEDGLADAEADLAELEEDVGVRIPTAEIVFLPDLPRTVTAIDVERGDFVTGSVMRISGTEVRITTGVSEANRPLLEVGQRVIIDSEQLGIEVQGEIAELADRTGTNGVADTRYYMLVVPTGDDYNVSEMVGINFRLQIPLEKSEGEVLAVPLAALSAGADGSSRVELLDSDGSTRLVTVEVGLQDKNRSLVEVTPLGDQISEGDFVVIGIEQAQTGAADDADSEEADS